MIRISSHLKDTSRGLRMALVSDKATEHYFEIQPAREPSDVDHYQNVINTKQFTMVNLAHLCSVKTETESIGNMITLLGPDIRSKDFYFLYEEVKGKGIVIVGFLFDVWVTRWSLLCAKKKSEWNVEYKWQVWDYKEWIDIGVTQQVQTHYTSGLMKECNPVEFVFINPEKSKGKKYKYWRVLGVSGVTEMHEYINLLFMNVV